jgi:hypothetical protein
MVAFSARDVRRYGYRAELLKTWQRIGVRYEESDP